MEVGAPARVTQNWGSNMHFTDLAIPRMFSAASLFTSPLHQETLYTVSYTRGPLYMCPLYQETLNFLPCTTRASKYTPCPGRDDLSDPTASCLCWPQIQLSAWPLLSVHHSLEPWFLHPTVLILKFRSPATPAMTTRENLTLGSFIPTPRLTPAPPDSGFEATFAWLLPTQGRSGTQCRVSSVGSELLP